MSTKLTICYGEDFHIYQEMCISDRVYVKLDNFKGDFSVENGKIMFSLSPELMNEICEAWQKNKDKLDSDPCIKMDYTIFKTDLE